MFLLVFLYYRHLPIFQRYIQLICFDCYEWLLVVRGMFDFVEKLEMHSVSKFHFWSKNYKFSKIDFFFSVIEFLRLNWSELMVLHIWAILGQNLNFWPISCNIWYILENKIQEYHWILAQKFKLDDLPDFVKIQFLDQKYDFWHSVEMLGRAWAG